MTIHIAINGHDRIGRNVLRDHYESGKIHDVEIVAIIDEPLIGEPASIMAIMRQKGGAVPVPVDLVVSKTFGGDASSRTLASDAAADDDIILDVGRRATAAYERQLGQAGTIVCNGPVGVFEKDAFACGTEGPGEASRSQARSTRWLRSPSSGSRRTLATSPGWWRALEFLEGKTLPPVAVLQAANRGGETNIQELASPRRITAWLSFRCVNCDPDQCVIQR